MNPKFERLVKKPGRTTDLEPEPTPEPEFCTPYHLLRPHKAKKAWQQNDPNVRSAIAFYHATKDSDPFGEFDVAIVPLKGTSFEDKRQNCLDFFEALAAGTNDGEVIVVAEENNEYDPNAVVVCDKLSGKKLGYIPRMGDVNAAYKHALAQGRLLCAYIIDGKAGKFASNQTATLNVATVWKIQ
jgi:hypothetical protein